MWFFQELVRQKVYSRIDYKFLVIGHTYGQTDRSFGVIENYTSRIKTVYTPHQWYVWTCEKCNNWNRGQRDGTIIFQKLSSTPKENLYREKPRQKKSHWTSLDVYGLTLERERRWLKDSQ